VDILELQKQISEFVKERDWDQFHSPKNLTMALSVEASELMEIFQWVSEKESYRISNDVQKKEAISDELADIFYYLLRLSHILNLDLQKSLTNKMEKNKIKYPVEKCKGKSTKYNQLD
jgi:dCTP diphosphatase